VAKGGFLHFVWVNGVPRMFHFYLEEYRHIHFLSQNCEETPSGVTVVDDEIQYTSSPSSSPSPTYDILDSLPPGWNSQTSVNGSRTTLILVLSLVLAFVICFVIIGLVFWRKNKRRNHRRGDVEMKARRRRRDMPDDEDREAMVQREIKAKQKIWARATARWKANVRYTARQRRGKRIASTSRVASRTNSVFLEQRESRAPSPTPSPVRPLSRHSSIESLYFNSPADVDIHSDAESHEQDPPPPPSPTTSSHGLPSSPPAYHQRATRPQHSQSIEGLTGDPTPSPLSSPHDHYPPVSSGEPADADSNSDLHPPPIPAAHVATDDKSLLARLAELASSPPSSELVSPEGRSSRPQVSAPVWQDENIEDFSSCPGESSSNHTSKPPTPTPLFPPPPSKGKMAEPAFYDYPYSFEEFTVEVEAGPSAPPFDDASSADSTDVLVLTPSAPPLSISDYYLEPRTGVPSDWEQDDEPASQVEGQDHELEISMIPSAPSTDALATDILTICVEGPVASDGTPPSYHP
jgi:hypothetical protein